MAEARLEAYQRKFVALELNAIAAAKFQDPHLHMRRVRHHVEASMKDRAAEVQSKTMFSHATQGS